MIFDIPYHHRKCEELALKKIFVHYTFSGRYLVVGRGEKKQDITLVRYVHNKKCISYFYNWISTTCRDIQTAIIKTCAYNNRFALKCAFGESCMHIIVKTILIYAQSIVLIYCFSQFSVLHLFFLFK